MDDKWKSFSLVFHLNFKPFLWQALTFYNGNNLIVKNLNIQDAQQIHVSFEKCVNVQVSNLKVTAPETSPNTDGIHVTNTQNIQISNCVIGTGIHVYRNSS